jgi:hypothetical protein
MEPEWVVCILDLTSGQQMRKRVYLQLMTCIICACLIKHVRLTKALLTDKATTNQEMQQNNSMTGWNRVGSLMVSAS